MFNKEELLRIKPILYFFIVYTLLFVFFAATFRFIFPFLAGFLLALLVQPLIRLLKEHLHCRPGLAAALSTLIAFVILFGLMFLLGAWLIYEISHLIDHISNMDISRFTAPLNVLAEQAGDYIRRIDENFIRENQEQIVSMARSGAGLATTVLSGILSFLTSLPAILTMFLVMIFSTYFFSKDMRVIKKHFTMLLSNSMNSHIRTASQHGASLSGKLVLSYLLIYFITFLETLVVFLALDVPYPLVLSIITGAADILPVLGPGTIYLPLSAIYLISGQWIKAGVLLLCWFLISAIRHVIEPKIVSDSIEVHPLTVLAAIYFALAANHLVLLIYFAFLLVLYQVLTQTGILPTIFQKEE